jgi:REP element-mobilizing transposase RayT
VRDLIRQIDKKHESSILSGHLANNQIHVLVANRWRVDVSRIGQWLKEFSLRILL